VYRTLDRAFTAAPLHRESSGPHLQTWPSPGVAGRRSLTRFWDSARKDRISAKFVQFGLAREKLEPAKIFRPNLNFEPTLWSSNSPQTLVQVQKRANPSLHQRKQLLPPPEVLAPFPTASSTAVAAACRRRLRRERSAPLPDTRDHTGAA
jgi:hypothetical protein